jgi:hypothetical protein
MTADAADSQAAISAAMSVAREVAEGHTDAASLEAAFAAAAREQVAQVVGPGDLLWELHGDVTRQYLAAGGMSADELAEWTAVARRREAEAGPAQLPAGAANGSERAD